MYNELFLFAAVFTALLIFMIDYGLGLPADEKVGYGSFLFSYSLFLATRRMKGANLYSMYYGQYLEQLSNAENDLQKHRIRRSFQELIFTQGRELFSWEKAFGMCPYCSHFWTTLISFSGIIIFCRSENIFIFTFYLLISHALIRFFKKYF